MNIRAKQLIQATREGRSLVCSRRSPASLTTSLRYRVKAKDIRDILLGRTLPDPDPRGLHIIGARITGQLDLEGVESSVRLTLQGCSFDRSIVARNAHLPSLSLDGSKLSKLNAEGLRIDGDASLDVYRSFSFEAEAVQLHGAHIEGELRCPGAKLHNRFGRPALQLDGVSVRSIFLNSGFEASTNTGQAAVLLDGASITGLLDLSTAKLKNDQGGAALKADGMHANNAFLRNGFEAEADTENWGAVQISAALIEDGLLQFDGAILINKSGTGLQAAGLKIPNGCIFLNDKFNVSAHKKPAVDLRGAEVGLAILFGDDDKPVEDAATIVSTDGPVLRADHLQVGERLSLKGTFKCEAPSNQEEEDASDQEKHVAISLRGANLGLEVDFSHSKIENESEGPIFDLRSARTENLALPSTVVCNSKKGDRRCTKSKIELDGFSYARIRNGNSASFEQWRHWLRKHTSGYTPQPYRQLAQAFSSAGNEKAARKILIAQQRHLRSSKDWRRKPGYVLFDLCVGFGYQVMNAIGVIIVLVGSALILGHLAASFGATVCGCSLIEQFRLGLDQVLPFPGVETQNKCRLDTRSGVGQILWASFVMLRVFSWALFIMVIAGMRNLMRKP